MNILPLDQNDLEILNDVDSIYLRNWSHAYVIKKPLLEKTYLNRTYTNEHFIVNTCSSYVYVFANSRKKTETKGWAPTTINYLMTLSYEAIEFSDFFSNLGKVRYLKSRLDHDALSMTEKESKEKFISDFMDRTTIRR